MAKKRYRPEGIIGKLREADVLISQGTIGFWKERRNGLQTPCKQPARIGG